MKALWEPVRASAKIAVAPIPRGPNSRECRLDQTANGTSETNGPAEVSARREGIRSTGGGGGGGEMWVWTAGRMGGGGGVCEGRGGGGAKGGGGGGRPIERPNNRTTMRTVEP